MGSWQNREPQIGTDMRDPHTLKKSESLEIRLPHATKQAFMARCRSEQRSASEALRAFIEASIEGPAPAKSKTPLRLAAAGVALLAFGAMAAPSLAHPSLPAQFARLDANHDGSLSPAEFGAAASLKIAVSVGAGEHPLDGSLDAGLRDRLIRREFDRIDADRNGGVSLAEFRAYYSR
jgi:hypothetical protein